MAYVYVYLDPRKCPPEPIYIGKGVGKRLYHHISGNCKNSILIRKLSKIKECGLSPIIEKLADNLSNEEASKLEIKLISKYGRITTKTGTLCNFTEGGEGTVGYKHKKETLKLFSSQRKGKKQTKKQYIANCSRVISNETRNKISKASKGHKWHSIEQFILLKNQQYGAHKFLVIFPDGEIKQITNLSKFCKKYNLDRTSCTRAATSKLSYKNYKFQRL